MASIKNGDGVRVEYRKRQHIGLWLENLISISKRK